MSGLEERVGTLLESGRGDLASDLLRASFHSRSIDEVEFVSEGRVRVVSGPFCGEHDVDVDDTANVSVGSESRYQYRGEDIETGFRVRSLTDSERQTIRNAMYPDCETEKTEDTSAPTAETNSRTVLADGGPSEPSPAGLQESLLNVVNKVLP